MSTEQNRQLSRHCFEEIGTPGNWATDDARCAESRHEALDRKIFGLALALATEPSKLGHLRQMLVHLQEQKGIPEGFSSWALGQLDERVMSMALAYAHDAELIVQVLSFKGGTFASLLQTIEDLYQHEHVQYLLYLTRE